MYTTFHLASAQEVSTDILDAIKAAYKTKPITITIEEDESVEISTEMKAILDSRLNEDSSNYLTADESLNHLKKRYDL